MFPLWVPVFPDPPQVQVVGGSPSTDRPEVVALLDDGGRVVCSGTLVHPDWVLTAAHCLDDLGQDQAVFFGDTLDTPTHTRGIAESIAHPDYDPSTIAADVGLLRLDASVDDVHPAVVGGVVAAEWLGEPFEMVGFGETVDGTTGEKRVTEIPLTDFTAVHLICGDPNTNLCNGDSGGPAFRQGMLVGVNAFVIDGCVGGATGAIRVDTVQGFLAEHVPGIESPPPVPPETRDTGWGDPLSPEPGLHRGCAVAEASIWTDTLPRRRR